MASESQQQSGNKKTSQTIVWKDHIRSLEEYCVSKGWTVKYFNKKNKQKNVDAAYPFNGVVHINKDRRAEVTFYYFLHELGHMILCENSKYDQKYTAVYDGYHPSSQVHKITKVEEEIEAWKTGYRLAKRLKLKVNQRNFEAIKSRCLVTYFVWAAKRNIINLSKKRKK